MLNPAVFPRQEGNDCGPCVNFLATMFARDPGTFHSMLKLKDTAFEFPPSNEMRIDQAKEIFGPLVYLFQSCMLCVQIICLCMKSVLDYRLVTTKVETACVGN